MIVIDSVTFHFRHDFEDMGLRTRLLNNMAQNLMGIAESQNLAVLFSGWGFFFVMLFLKVVLMNQMTTKVGESESSLVPALGNQKKKRAHYLAFTQSFRGKLGPQLYKSNNFVLERRKEIGPLVQITFKKSWHSDLSSDFSRH